MSVHGAQPAAEPLLGMRDITRYIETCTGHKPGRSTIWRWSLEGRLEARRIGGRLYATESAIRRMLDRDAMRNRGSAGCRGLAAKLRVETLLGSRRPPKRRKAGFR
jgi:hypothetical protein